MPIKIKSQPRSASVPGDARHRRPFVYINIAMTADGKIASSDRAINSFGSARDQQHLLELRSTADAIMAGARTVDSEPINLGPGPRRFRQRRLRLGLAECPVRILVSGSASVDPHAEVLRHRNSPLILLASRGAPAARLRRLGPLFDSIHLSGRGGVDFSKVLPWLKKEWGIRRLLVEGGGELNDSLFRGGWVDELHITWCPKIFGGREAPTLADGVGAASLGEAAHFELLSRRRIRDELFLVYRRPAATRRLKDPGRESCGSPGSAGIPAGELKKK